MTSRQSRWKVPNLEAHFEALGQKWNGGSTSATSAPALTEMQKVIDDFQRKYPNGTPKVSKREPSPEVLQMAEALRRARRGDIAEASATTGADRLPRYVVPS